MGILDKLRNITDQRRRVVANDLNRLDEVQRGLADKALAFVLGGRDATVLATISTLCKGDELEVAVAWLPNESPSWPRRRLLAQQQPFDDDFTKRYAQVLSAACPSLPDSAVGSDAVPSDVRVLFSEAFPGIRANTNRWPP